MLVVRVAVGRSFSASFLFPLWPAMESFAAGRPLERNPLATCQSQGRDWWAAACVAVREAACWPRVRRSRQGPMPGWQPSGAAEQMGLGPLASAPLCSMRKRGAEPAASLFSPLAMRALKESSSSNALRLAARAGH